MSAPVGTLQFNSYVGRNFTIFFSPGSFLLLTDSQVACGVKAGKMVSGRLKFKIPAATDVLQKVTMRFNEH